MSLRRFVVLFRGLGYVFQHAPSTSTLPDVDGASNVSGSVTSIRDFARVLGNPKEYVGG